MIRGVSYRYGFNGQEKDDEVKGSGNSLEFEARIYDSRLGRWLSTDPREGEYAWQSPFAYFMNSPIAILDEFGEGGGKPPEDDANSKKCRTVNKAELPPGSKVSYSPHSNIRTDKDGHYSTETVWVPDARVERYNYGTDATGKMTCESKIMGEYYEIVYYNKVEDVEVSPGSKEVEGKPAVDPIPETPEKYGEWKNDGPPAPRNNLKDLGEKYGSASSGGGVIDFSRNILATSKALQINSWQPKSSTSQIMYINLQMNFICYNVAKSQPVLNSQLGKFAASAIFKDLSTEFPGTLNPDPKNVYNGNVFFTNPLRYFNYFTYLQITQTRTYTPASPAKPGIPAILAKRKVDPVYKKMMIRKLRNY